MNENHEGQAPLVPGADGIAATAISCGEAPKAVDLGRPSTGAFANEADLSSEMGEGDMDSKCEIDRLKQKIVSLEIRVVNMRMEIGAVIGLAPSDLKHARAMLAVLNADQANSTSIPAIAAAKILKLLVDTEAPIV
jgi:hypothetical protein